MSVNKQLVLDSRPTDKVAPAHFRLIEAPIRKPGAGEILVRNHFLSLDPYMRGRLSDAKSYAKPQEIGAVMGGGSVGEIVESNNPRFKIGDFVVGMGGWQQYFVTDGAGFNVVDAKAIPLQAYLGVVGMPGVTAWYGLNKIIAPKPGETVVVSAASGAVGGVVGQLAKIAGAKVVGIAGGPEKCAFVKDELRFDAAVDHRAADFPAQLAAACPDGIDVYFENVGGAIWQAVLPLINKYARVPVSGLIAQYNGSGPGDGTDRLPATMREVLSKSLTLRGFINSEFAEQHYAEFVREVGAGIADGRIRYREDIVDGLDKAPEAFIGMLHGRNFGKLIVRVGATP